MNATIIFGTKKLGQSAAAVVAEKYPNQAVITVEGQKGAKKSRRVLLNSKAADLLGCEAGSVQNLVFASVEMNDTDGKQVLIANASTMPPQEEKMITYKTSKNKVSYGDDSKEKGKAVTSSHVCTEIFSFLSKDDSENIEFELVEFPSEQLEAFSLETVGSSNEDSDSNQEVTIDSAPAITGEELAEEAIIETNQGSMNGQEVAESIQSEVAAAEAANPVLVDDSRNEVLATNDWME